MQKSNLELNHDLVEDKNDVGAYVKIIQYYYDRNGSHD